MDMFSEVVSGCLVQEIPHLEVSIDDPSVDIREQLLICIMEQGTMNISIGGSAFSVLNEPTKHILRALELKFGLPQPKRLPSLRSRLHRRSEIMPCKLFMRSLGFR